ncbi:MAG: endonuclease domain-containing protein [Bacteroidota bacterium]|nr:endonuclease domain-containing protein [Bacteroidota bacterium]
MTKFYNKTEYKEKRKFLRNNPTKTEKLIWDILKGKKLEGFKFRRQYGVGKYVIDFFCINKKLAIELDGEVHDNEESKVYDKDRDYFLKSFGINILRIRNENVENNIEGVIEMILKELKK